MKFEDVWLGKLGTYRTNALVRSLGFMLYLTCLGHWGKNPLPYYLERYPPSSLLLGLCGFALMLAGPHLILLLTAALSGANLIWLVLHGRGGPGLRQQAAEYPMLMLIPAALAVLALALFVEQRKAQEGWARLTQEFERHALLIFRWAALSTLFFAGFHKLNSDFFRAVTSCEEVVKQYAIRNWSLPGLDAALKLTSPALIVLMESAVPILLLLFCRRLGVLVVALFYGGVALTDALVVTLCIIVPALAFLKEQDWETLRANWKKPGLLWMALLLAWLPVSAAHYRGSRPWLQPALYQCLLLLILTALAWLIWRDLSQTWRRRRGGAARAPAPAIEGGATGSVADKEQASCSLHTRRVLAALGWGRPALFSGARPGGVVVAVWVALLFVNGFSPYLGLKFNYSFAMLSNLRVDDARWNHFLMPKWLRLTNHDGFVHVLFAETHYRDMSAKAVQGRVRALKPGLFSPQAFHDTLDQLQAAKGGVELRLLVEFQGEALDYVGSAAAPDFARFREQLPPPRGHWLHDYLAAEGPMGCKH